MNGVIFFYGTFAHFPSLSINLTLSIPHSLSPTSRTLSSIAPSSLSLYAPPPLCLYAPPPSVFILHFFSIFYAPSSLSIALSIYPLSLSLNILYPSLYPLLSRPSVPHTQTFSLYPSLSIFYNLPHPSFNLRKILFLNFFNIS